MERTLALDGAIRQLAAELVGYPNFLYLGRGLHHPIALEGALKLKELAYVHAEGYPAGEMKHGLSVRKGLRRPWGIRKYTKMSEPERSGE